MRRFLSVATRAAGCALLLFGAKAQDQQPPSVSLELLISDTKVAADGSYLQTVHSELHATNEAGALQIARIDLPFNTGMQTIDVLEAYTLKADGKKIPVDLTTIFEQLPPAAAQSGMVTDQRVKVLFFPQFSAGDSAIYTMRITELHPHFAGTFFTGEIFPRTIAYKQVRESITAPTSMGLRVENHGLTFSKAQEGDNTVYTWRYAAPVTKKAETAFVSPIDREPRFFISSFKDYAALGRAYGALAQPKIVATAAIKALADHITGGETDHKEQARKLYEWVTHNIRYVAIELGHGSFEPHNVDKIIADGYGDCKDHDVLLQSLLKAKGIDAESVLVNSSNAYSLTEAPSFTQLDHVITFVPEFGTYLDASVPVAPFGVLPLPEYGKPAIHVSAKTARLTTIPVLKPGIASIHTTTEQKLAPDGTISGTTTTTTTGPYAISLRMIGLAVQALGAEKAATMQLASRGYKDGTGKLLEEPPMGASPSYKIRGDFNVKGWGSLLTGEATIMPGGLRVAVVSGDGIMGPLYGSTDTNDEATACYSGKADEDISLELPSGYRIREVPKDTKITTPNLSFTAHWNWSGKALSVHREFASTIDQPLCSGTIRKQSADALKKIAATYDTTFEITDGKTPPENKAEPNQHDAEALIERGNELVSQKQFDAAIEDFNQAIKLDPQSSWARNARGAAYLNAGKFDLAIADFDAALALEPGYAQAHNNRGIAYARQGQWAKSIAELDQAEKLDPENTDTLIERASSRAAMNQFAAALDDLSAAIKAKPDSARAYANRAEVRLRTNDVITAVTDCDQALKLDPQYIWGLRICSMVQRVSGNAARALQYLDTALTLEPKSADLRVLRGLFYNNTGDPRRAITDFDVALVVEPNNIGALILRGEAHQALKQYSAALADYDHAIAQKPSLASAHGSRLSTLIAMGRTEDAQRDCTNLIAANPNKGWPYAACSRLKRALGDDKGANLDIARAEQIEPGSASTTPPSSVASHTSSSAPPAFVAFSEGLQHMNSEMYTQAVRDFERAGKLGLNDGMLLPQLCKALAHTERLPDAAYQCSRALQREDGDAQLWDARGYAYYRQGKFAEALQDFDHMVQSWPKDAVYLYERGITKTRAGDAVGGQKDIAKAKQMNAAVAQQAPKAMRQ